MSTIHHSDTSHRQLRVALRSVAPLEKSEARLKRQVRKLEAALKESHDTAAKKQVRNAVTTSRHAIIGGCMTCRVAAQTEWEDLMTRLQRKCASMRERNEELSGQVRQLQHRNVKLSGELAASGAALQAAGEASARVRDDLAGEVLRAREEAQRDVETVHREALEARVELEAAVARERAASEQELTRARAAAEQDRQAMSETLLADMESQRQR